MSNHPYVLSFTAASLRPELARIVAETFLTCRDWDLAKRRILGENLLQARSSGSAVRMEREFRQRLQMLTTQQMEILATAPLDSCRAIAWLSVLKHSLFVFDFASEVLRSKIQDLDPVLRPSDYVNFVSAQMGIHPELANLSAASKLKIGRVVKTMLREAGILEDSNKSLLLHQPLIPPLVLSAIVSDNRRWLSGFLVPDAEI